MRVLQRVDNVRGAWEIGSARSLDAQHRSGCSPLQNETRAGDKHLGVSRK